MNNVFISANATIRTLSVCWQQNFAEKAYMCGWTGTTSCPGQFWEETLAGARLEKVHFL